MANTSVEGLKPSAELKQAEADQYAISAYIRAVDHARFAGQTWHEVDLRDAFIAGIAHGRRPAPPSEGVPAVKRYEMLEVTQPCDVHSVYALGEHKDGSYVLASDYLTLLHLYDEAVAEREHVRGFITDVNAKLNAEINAHLTTRRDREAAQARIDALMLEYCPDEITAEQLDNWAKHQVQVAKDDIDATTPT